MTRHAPHPGFLPGTRVTLIDPRWGALRLIVTESRLPTNGGPAWVTCTNADGSGRYRRPATDLQHGWGN
jgi:hypothetical protein